MQTKTYRRFAWDGFSFETPDDWNLSQYKQTRDLSFVRMEDDHALRLELEYGRLTRPADHARWRDHQARTTAELTRAGAEAAPVADLPDGWSAFQYSWPDHRHLILAFRLAADTPFFCLLKLHFDDASRREPPRLLRTLTAGFRLHATGPLPWAVYDFAFRLPRVFRLTETAFQAGRKLMVFEWRRRRLHLWFCSLADVVLRERTPAAWAADFLNAFKGIRGPRFVAVGENAVESRFSWRYPLGHFEELFRGCFRYRVWCAHLPERNQLMLCVFQHRREDDLRQLALEGPPLFFDAATPPP